MQKVSFLWGGGRGRREGGGKEEGRRREGGGKEEGGRREGGGREEGGRREGEGRDYHLWRVVACCKSSDC